MALKPQTKLAVWLFLSALFFYIFHIRYFAWRDCFNENGRCYDPDGSGDVYTTAGAVWIIPAILFMLLALLNIFRLASEQRRGGGRQERDS